VGLFFHVEPLGGPLVSGCAGGGHAKSPAYNETFIDELVGRFQAESLCYFGDIDPAGLRIDSQAAQRRALRHALPASTRCVALHVAC
jgi:hypothetical protein